MPGRSSKKNTVGVQISSNKELPKHLKALPVELQLKLLRTVLKRQGKRLNDAARGKVPVGGERKGRKADKKHLRDSLMVGSVKWASKDAMYVVAGPGWPSGAHGHLVEFGHNVAGGFGGRTRPQPFMRPAASETTAANIRDMEKSAKRWFKRQYGKIPKKAKA